MKKQLLIISIIVVIVSIFVSCSANSSSENISTTAVTDEQGTMHYYEPVTENESTSVFAEIVTDDNGKAVTKKNGEYVTKEHTTILTTAKEAVSSITGSATERTQENPADNEIEFETSTNKNTTTAKETTTTTTKPTEKETTTTAAPTTKVVTDKDGWIDKWY